MSSLSDNIGPEFDIRLLTAFIHEFSVTRRHVLSYPGGHPIIAASAAKALDLFSKLLTNIPEITLGVAKDILIIGDTILDKNNHTFRNLAQLFFSHGIASITFSAKLTETEIINFCKIISVKREALDAKGGIASIMEKYAGKGVNLTTIDYSAFLATDDGLSKERFEAMPDKIFETIWQELVMGLLQGTLVKKSDLSNINIDISPSELSEMLNNNRHIPDEDRHVTYEQILAAFVQHLEKHPNEIQKEELLKRLNDLISRLTPDLRNHFVQSAFKSLAENKTLAEKFLSQLPEETIIEALDSMIARKTPLPTMLFSLIGKLSANLGALTSQMAFELGGSEKEELQNKLRVLFNEESHDKFTPESYQDALNSVIRGDIELNPDRAEIEELKNSLNAHKIEGQVSLILLDIINHGFDELGGETMVKNLLDLSNYFLSSGDFASLIQMHDRLSCKSAIDSNDRYSQLLGLFNEPEFIQEVIQGVVFWGKSKYQEIGNLMVRIGGSFVDPILDRLAEEQSMSLRRYYMEIIQRIGEDAREKVIARLRDNRWYFIRNLIILLRTFGKDIATPHLRRLTYHPNPKVKQEAVKALLDFNDPEADRLLIRDLADENREVVLNAVRLAEHSRGREVILCLSDFLDRNGLTGFEYELKSAAIHSMSVIASPSCIPVIDRFLRSRSIFRSKQLNALKIEAVRSLSRYPKQSAAQLLKEISISGHRSLREIAAETLLSIQGGES